LKIPKEEMAALTARIGRRMEADED
jgi:hypothetical protein